MSEPNSPKEPENVKITTLYLCTRRRFAAATRHRYRKILLDPQCKNNGRKRFHAWFTWTLFRCLLLMPDQCMQRSEPRHDKTNKMSVRPAKTQISLGIRPVWSESSPSTWRNLGSLATHWAHSEDSVQTGRMPRLIWVFAGHTFVLLVSLNLIKKQTKLDFLITSRNC